LNTELLLRATENRLYSFFYSIVQSKVFKQISFLMIIANTVVLGITQRDDDKNFVNLLELLNLLFFGFFVFELLTKLIGEGFKFYLRE
jgi:Ion transport protein